MNKVLDFKLVLLFQLCHHITNSGSTYDDAYDQHDSQSQENDSDLDEREQFQHFERSNGIQNYGYDKDGNVLSYLNQYNECNSCACNKCDNPPDCCKEVCKSCSKISLQISPFQMMPMPQIAQLPIAMSQQSPMSVPQLLQGPMKQITIPQMQLPQQRSQLQMPMTQPQMAGYQFPTALANQFPNNTLYYFPFPSNFVNLLKGYSQLVSAGSKMNSNKTSTTTPAVMYSTTTVSTTISNVTSTTTIPVSLKEATVTGNESNQQRLRILLQPENKNMLEAALKSVLKAFSNNMFRAADKTNGHSDKYVLASTIRRTKPVISNSETSRYGNGPVRNNMADGLKIEMRDAKSFRDRHE